MKIKFPRNSSADYDDYEQIINEDVCIVKQ